jgi:hypothetical protein
MATDILIKRSTTSGAIPTTGDLSTGELAINTADKRLFTNNSGTIVEIGTAPTSLAVTNNATVGGTLGVTGNTTLTTVTTSGAATLASGSVTGNFSVAGTLTVATPSNSTDAASKGYVDTAVANVIDSAPGALDTLNELAAAINDDANFATTITNSIATKLPLAGGTMTGDITLGANKATSTATPTTDDTLTRKGYVDSILGSATDAATSATAAASSATDAANSASAASTSASNASTSATNAATSATNASTSETNAATSASSASSSATASANSATAAATSATNASTSETNAATRETNAATSETNAATSETNAATSASSASTSATNAATSATSSSTSATNAATSETNAANSASAASTSETNAATSASSAASAQTAAESARDATLAAYDQFDDRYLGAKASDPSVDNDGDALVAGALYFNTTDESMKLYTGSAWVDAYASGSGFLTDIVGDTTPQLGGNLDTNGNDITFGDNDKAIFGAGSDLQIYHDGSNSKITDVGTGSLLLGAAGQLYIQNETHTENMARFTANSSVELYYDNSKKFETTSTGIDVTGTVTADGLTVDGTTTVGNNQSLEILDGVGDISLRVSNLSSSGNSGVISVDPDNTGASSALQIHIDGTNKRVANFAAGGDISFYEDTGTTPKLFWDASAESLGIGTSSPSQNLEVYDATNSIVLASSGNSGASQFCFGDDGSDFVGRIYYDHSTDSMRFHANTSERMRIDSSGNLLVGKTAEGVGNVGFQARPDGFLAGTRNGGTVSYLNRLTSDGEILRFQKDSTTVGSIGIADSGDRIYLAGPGLEGVGIDNGANAFVPTSEAGAFKDNHLALGRSDARFTDLYLSGNSFASNYRGVDDTDTFIAISGGDVMRMFTANSERMRIDSSGNLHVACTTHQASASTGSGGYTLGSLGVSARANDVAHYFNRIGTDGSAIEFRKNGSIVGSASVTSSGTTYNTTSDARLKTDIQPIADATDRLMQMNPVSHKWVADPEADAVVGFIAQEMQEIVPEAVSGTPDGEEMMSMDYGRITPVLVAALQDAHRKIEELESRLAAVEAK